MLGLLILILQTDDDGHRVAAVLADNDLLLCQTEGGGGRQQGNIAVVLAEDYREIPAEGDVVVLPRHKCLIIIPADGLLLLRPT